MSPGDVSLEDGAISSLQEMIFSRLSQEHDGSDSLILQVFRLDLLQRGVATGVGQRSNCFREAFAAVSLGLVVAKLWPSFRELDFSFRGCHPA